MRNYKDKYFSVLGDSISTFEGFTAPKGDEFYTMAQKMASGVVTYADTWWGQVIERLGGKFLTNHSISGSIVVQLPTYKSSYSGCSDERTSALGKDGIAPDVILVFLGINDWGHGLQVVSNRNLPSDAQNCALFSVGYRTMLEKMKANYPDAEIWCLTLAKNCCTANPSYRFNSRIGGREMSEYCDAILNVAAQQDCHAVDLYNGGKEYDTIDGAHPNASGMCVIAEQVIAAMTKN